MAGFVPRIYEYAADDGTVYYSFTKHPATISPPKRLVLQNKMGTILPNFIVNLRGLAQGNVPESVEGDAG